MYKLENLEDEFFERGNMLRDFDSSLDQSIILTEINDEQLLDKEEMQNQLLRMTTKMNSAKNLRGFLSGVKL